MESYELYYKVHYQVYGYENVGYYSVDRIFDEMDEAILFARRVDKCFSGECDEDYDDIVHNGHLEGPATVYERKEYSKIIDHGSA